MNKVTHFLGDKYDRKCLRMTAKILEQQFFRQFCRMWIFNINIRSGEEEKQQKKKQKKMVEASDESGFSQVNLAQHSSIPVGNLVENRKDVLVIHDHTDPSGAVNKIFSHLVNFLPTSPLTRLHQSFTVQGKVWMAQSWQNWADVSGKRANLLYITPEGFFFFPLISVPVSDLLRYITAENIPWLSMGRTSLEPRALSHRAFG